MKIASLICICFLSACTWVPTKSSLPENLLVQKALSGELILQHEVSVDDLPNDDLFGLTNEMKHFAESAVKFAERKDVIATMLHQSLITSTAMGGQGIKYSTFTTGTAKEVFDSARANCLGYTILYVSLARYLGLKAEVNEVSVPPAWNMDNRDNYFVMRHVNAKVIFQRSPWSFVRDMNSVTSDITDIVVDMEISRFRKNYPQRSLDKTSVEALYYNNRAMELVIDGNEKQAFLYARKAIEIKPDETYVWSNFASLYRRRGELPIAEAIYLHALQFNKKDLTLLHNLAGLYMQMNQPEKSDIYHKQVRRYRNANPYYLYQLAVKAMENGKLEKAKEYIQKAIKKESNDDRFYLLAAEIFDKNGETEAASRMREKADSIKID